VSGRADEVLAAEYDDSKAEVLRTVSAKLGGTPPSGVDLEAAYNEAWHALYLRLEEGEEVTNRKGFLVTVAYRRALSEHRAVRLEHAANGDLAEIAVEPDIEAHLDAEIQLRHLRQGLRAELDERELQAATLCLLHGYSRPEAARRLGIAPRRMEKLMDRATRRINAVIGVVRPGELCESFDSMVRAFAVGMLDEDGERYRLARDHLADCPACRRKVLVLRGLGSITPPLPALFGILAGTAGAAGVGAKAGLGAKAGATKGIVGKLGAKGAGLSHRAALVGGSVTAAAAVAAVVAVAATGGGGGDKPPPSNHQTPTPATAQVAEPSAEDPAPTASKPAPKAPAHEKKAKHKKHAKKAKAAKTPPSTAEAPPVEPEPPVETEIPVEPAPEPTPEPAPEPTPEPPPPAPKSEPQPPLKDAGVEFELR
jgi:DNA-directed RNA polymerase specialized sigma24 family protein